MTRILLVDDDAELVALVGDYLRRDGFEVETAADGATGVKQALSGRFALVVLDIMMPRLNGEKAMQLIRRESSVPVLMLTARGGDEDCVIGLELGADDYVTKPCTLRQLTARIRAVLRRGTPVSPHEPDATVVSCGSLRLYPERRHAEWAGDPLLLTSTQYNILEVLAKHAGQPVAKPDICEQALGRSLTAHDRSVDVHISSIRRKLGVMPDGRSRIQFVRPNGYQLLKA